MKRIILLFAFCLTYTTLVWCQDHSHLSINKKEVSQKTDQLVKDYMDLGIFSGVVMIAHKGKPFYHQAFGKADREKLRPNTIHTLFDIGSMNKTFTSIVVKQMIREGKLRYSDKLTQYIGGFEDPRASQITVEHLLNHESGFGDYHHPGYFQLPRHKKSLQHIVQRLKGEQLLFAPGDGNEYSNSGYVLLGAIIEKASGSSYFEQVRQRIIQPLGLKSTYIENLDPYEDRIAHGYYFTPLGHLEKNETLQDLPNPDGGFLSTTTDILTFYRSFYYDDVLLDEKTKMEDPYFRMLAELPKGRAPLTAGGFEGFNTAFFQVLSDDVSIIVFANMDEPVAEHLAFGILQIIRGLTPDQPKLPAVQNVRKAYEQKGIEFVSKNFEDLTTNYHPADPKDWILNSLGYAYLYSKKSVEAALPLFELNTRLFPEVANTWDSLGEALLQSGKKNEAMDAYQKALSIDPELPSAKAAVDRLN